MDLIVTLWGDFEWTLLAHHMEMRTTFVTFGCCKMQETCRCLSNYKLVKKDRCLVVTIWLSV